MLTDADANPDYPTRDAVPAFEDDPAHDLTADRNAWRTERRQGKYLIWPDEIAELLDLPPGREVLRVWAEQDPVSISVLVQGPDLDPVPPMCESPVLHDRVRHGIDGRTLPGWAAELVDAQAARIAELERTMTAVAGGGTIVRIAELEQQVADYAGHVERNRQLEERIAELAREVIGYQERATVDAATIRELRTAGKVGAEAAEWADRTANGVIADLDAAAFELRSRYHQQLERLGAIADLVDRALDTIPGLPGTTRRFGDALVEIRDIVEDARPAEGTPDGGSGTGPADPSEQDGGPPAEEHGSPAQNLAGGWIPDPDNPGQLRFVTFTDHAKHAGLQAELVTPDGHVRTLTDEDTQLERFEIHMPEGGRVPLELTRVIGQALAAELLNDPAAEIGTVYRAGPPATRITTASGRQLDVDAEALIISVLEPERPPTAGDTWERFHPDGPEVVGVLGGKIRLRQFDAGRQLGDAQPVTLEEHYREAARWPGKPLGWSGRQPEPWGQDASSAPLTANDLDRAHEAQLQTDLAQARQTITRLTGYVEWHRSRRKATYRRAQRDRARYKAKIAEQAENLARQGEIIRGQRDVTEARSLDILTGLRIGITELERRLLDLHEQY